MMNKNVAVMGIMVVSCVVATGPAWAQMQPQAAQPQQSGVDAKRTQLLDEINKKQERASALQQRINAVAQQAQEQNPDIQKLHADLMDIYQKKLAEYGYPSETAMQKLREMQQRLTTEQGSMDEAERQQLTQQFNTEVAKLRQAEEKAQRDAKVQAAHQAFVQARSKGMSETDPDIQTLEREFETLQGKLEQLRMQLQQVLQAPHQ
jgi:chromosome segregation ATPase